MTATDAPITTLLDELGGPEAVAAAVDGFYARVLADPELAPMFAKSNMTVQRGRLTKFVVGATGGEPYRGRSMREAHAGMGITGHQFGLVAGHLVAQLESMGVPGRLVDQLVGAVAPLADDIVEEPTDTFGPSNGDGGSMTATITHNGSAPNGTHPGSTGTAFDVDFAFAMVEQAPFNVMFCDTDLVLRYVNKASIDTLRTIEHLLPCRVDEVIGKTIDIFHKHPEHQRRLLADPANLPHHGIIDLAGEKVDLNVTAVHDSRGTYVGGMATWSIVTEKVALEEEVNRIMSMMENAPFNVMLCDTDLVLQYMNPASRETLRSIEHLLPCRVDDIIGQSLDIFHKHPEHQRRLLADPANLPHKAVIGLGSEKLDLHVSAIRDKAGNYIGAMANWSVVTQKLEIENAVAANSEGLASASEELQAVSQQMSASAEETSAQAEVVSTAAEEVSNSVQTVATGVEEMTASVKEIAHNAAEAARVASDAVVIANETNGTVSKLGDSSAEIGKIVKVITSIAQQTNLLALNATIEAARAGEAGKGFAVVANEVKELAKDTARATEDIGQKIEAIQTDTHGAVEAIERIGEVINQIHDIQNTIASAVEEQAATTNEIGRSVAEAARGSSEIAENIVGVARAAKDTSDGASSTQQAAAELSRMASEMQELVAKSRA